MSDAEKPRAEEAKKAWGVRISPKVLKEFKENLPKSIVPLALTVLGALASQSALTVFNVFSEVSQTRRQLGYERERDVRLRQNEIMVRRAANSPLSGLKLVEEFPSSFLKMNRTERQSLAQRLRDAIDEGNRSLGTLEGFTGIESTLPRNWLPSQIELRSSNLDTLQTILVCVERPFQSDSARVACVRTTDTPLWRTTRALARSQAADQTATAAESMVEAERILRWDKGSHRFDMLLLRGLGALVVLGLCFEGFKMIIPYFLESRKVEAK